MQGLIGTFMLLNLEYEVSYDDKLMTISIKLRHDLVTIVYIEILSIFHCDNSFGILKGMVRIGNLTRGRFLSTFHAWHQHFRVVYITIPLPLPKSLGFMANNK